ncbi:MAG: matrixin family metalloprotease [Candidatus Gastranaerophilales bacterium]|nr:matrixin family metalloprotease [Candidatus Gastranaerophilales bacterium]
MQKISYVDNCLKNGQIIRWPESCMPLAVYIAPFRWYKSKQDEYKYKQLIIDAFNIWQHASDGKFTYKIVPSLNESQINIDWRRVDRTSLGNCNFNYDKIGRLYSAEVQIGLSDGVIHAQYQDISEVRHTIIHEIGHALGLSHSPYKNDIMYVPHQYGVISISEKDKTTFKWLYKFPYGKTSTEILTKYNIPTNSLDDLILKLEKGSKFTKTLKNEIVQDMTSAEKLDTQQNLLADMNKFNLSVQNIKVSDNIKNFFRKINK